MLKKRLIFTLLHVDGYFYLSRNFRLQKVGDVRWLKRNYNFSQVAFSIDELVILDVSRHSRDFDQFCQVIEIISEDVFVPIAAGGGIRSLEHVQKLIKSGADKVVLNTLLFENKKVVAQIAQQFGKQSIVGSVDCKYSEELQRLELFVENGCRRLDLSYEEALTQLLKQPVGELYLNSIDRDGTGFGYDAHLLENLPENLQIPLIIAGGAGKAVHLAQGLAYSEVDAVATAHLFNFIGDGLKNARTELIKDGHKLAVWNMDISNQVKNR